MFISYRNNPNKLILSLNTQRMLKVLLACLMVTAAFSTITVDLTQNNKYGNSTIYNTPCNKDSQIDLYFSGDTKLACTDTSCTTSGVSASTMKFMDIQGNDLVLTLTSAQIAKSTDMIVKGWPSNVVPIQYFFFKFQTADQTASVYVVVPVTTTGSNNSILLNVNVNNVDSSDTTFSSFVNLSKTDTISLSMFNYLDQADYSRFYHVTNTAQTETMLISATVLQLNKELYTSSLTQTFVPDPSASGNKLCYASNETSGLFQSHLRQSWPLWTWMISLFFFWLYYLMSDSETNSCHDKKFDNNKMTCWGFYSLHYLGHSQYFSKLSRASLLYFVFSFQAIVLAAIYSTRGMDKDPFTNFQMVIWTAAIAFGASLPIPFILGGIFLQGIYNTTLAKFNAVKKTRGTMLNKSHQQEAQLENQIDTLEEKLYTYYFVYYIIFFFAMICFWVPTIALMMRIHREWYYLQRIWLASLAIAFVLDNLIYDPLMSLLLGNTSFYRKRGYFYRFQLGQLYKEIEE